jgi:hypothetical protein
MSWSLESFFLFTSFVEIKLPICVLRDGLLIDGMIAGGRATKVATSTSLIPLTPAQRKPPHEAGCS